ncbi:PaaI family thioesterase [uncultured Rothia sp.]|uniref:PaaI family thioesterase n=1 Tax=uncultured Rothia sp. TaxID=316088 RepID=UPI003216CED0
MTESTPLDESFRKELLQQGIPEKDLHLYAKFGLGTLIPKLGIVFQEVSAQRTVATMPIETNTQPAGLLHGGASAALLETVGSFAAFSAAPEGFAAVGTELNITHLRPGLSGKVTAVCTAVRIGRTQCVHAVEIRNDAGDLVSIGRMTNQFVPLR